MGKTILVCDDDTGILDVMCIVLEMGGYEVISEYYSPKVYKDIADHKPALIILDLWMPLLSGDIISHHIKTNPETKDIPIIIASASPDGGAVARKALADRFIPKPFDLTVLLDAVKELVRN